MKILINGILGRMGEKFYSYFSKNTEHSIVAGIDNKTLNHNYSIPIESEIEKLIQLCDVVIDFSLPEASEKVLASCIKNNKNLIIGTTALPESFIQKLKEAGDKITVIHGNNFSLGVNLLFDFVNYLSSKMKNFDFDVELLETHHKFKKDSPSGTAKTLLNIMKNEYNNPKLTETHGREGNNLNRKNQIGVHAIRGGTVVGTHEIKFLGPSENISIKHEALSREVFVEGVAFCVEKMNNLSKGYFTVQDILEV